MLNSKRRHIQEIMNETYLEDRMCATKDVSEKKSKFSQQIEPKTETELQNKSTMHQHVVIKNKY